MGATLGRTFVASAEVAVPATILVADGDASLLGLLVVVLHLAGHTVLQASDGAEALAVAERERPDLVLSEVTMPQLSGVELAERLRARQDGYCPPVLLMGVACPPSLPERTGFLLQPFLPDRLLREVESLLAV
jgi:CheY-like chemotaxis protein